MHRGPSARPGPCWPSAWLPLPCSAHRATADQPTWQAAALASSFLDSTRAAVYGMQDVAAPVLGGAPGEARLNRGRAASQPADAGGTSAGTGPEPPPLGYSLPFPVAHARRRGAGSRCRY